MSALLRWQLQPSITGLNFSIPTYQYQVEKTGEVSTEIQNEVSPMYHDINLFRFFKPWHLTNL